MSERLVASTGEEIAGLVVWARTAGARLRGVMGRELESGVAFILTPAYQVHTFFLRNPLDIALCDPDWKVLWVRRSMPPNRLSAWRTRGRYAIEMRAGSMPAAVQVGAELALVHVE